jgi:hypothetical protein
MESSQYLYGKGLVGKWSGPIGKRDRVGVVKVHSRLWRETALLRTTGESMLEGISSEVVGWLQTPGNYPEDNILHPQQGESLKTTVHKTVSTA